ncbi:MAG: histidine phosphotransferase [Caulobacteraceae bacterium]|nr:histidine phosphotransferase [Caulobacter sp.]
MSDFDLPADDAAPADAPQVKPADLAAALAARMCHDFISPASAIVSGMDLLDDPSAADMRDDAMTLISTSAKKLVDMLAFSRIAFGASAAADTFDVRDLQKLVEGVFAHVRADLEWRVEAESLGKPGARALLNLAQLGAGALPIGGTARISGVVRDGAALLAVEAVGPRARLRPEVADGLAGRRLGEGLAGHWVQGYYLHELLEAVGGRVEALVEDGRVLLRARAPQ